MQNHSCENDFYYHANETYKKSFALRLVLRVRVFGTRIGPILACSVHELKYSAERREVAGICGNPRE